MELFTKSVEENRCCKFMFRRNRSNHCKQKNLQLTSQRQLYNKVMQPMSAMNATNYDVKVNIVVQQSSRSCKNGIQALCVKETDPS
jgi:hypothetical protein